MASSSHGRLEDRFKAFLQQLPDTESIDSCFCQADFSGGKRADYLPNKRQIVLELKSVESDPEFKVEALLKEFVYSQSDCPKFYGQVPLEQLLVRMK